MPKKILVVLRGNINSDARVKKEIGTLLALGYKVTLALWNIGEVFYRNEAIEIIDIKYGKQKSNFGKIFTFARIIAFWRNVSKIIDQGQYDYVHCNDLNTLGVLFFVPRRSHTHFIYDAHELFPEQFKKSSPRYKIWTWVERKLLKRVKAVIATEQNRADYLKTKYGLPNPPYVVNNFPLYQIIRPKDLKGELNLECHKKLLCYSGLVLPDRGIETIVEALKYLPEDYSIIIIGYAYDQKYLSRVKCFIQSLGYETRVHHYGSVRSEDLLSVMAGCDICVALYEKTGLNNYYCSPNKVFDSIMAGVKVITNDYPSLQMLKNYGFIRLISRIDPRLIAAAALELVNEDCPIPENIKNLLSWQSLEGIFRQIYDQKMSS